MLSDDMDDLRDLVRHDDKLPAAARAIIASFLDDFAERARSLEAAVVPAAVRAVPQGCVDLGAERALRRHGGGRQA